MKIDRRLLALIRCHPLALLLSVGAGLGSGLLSAVQALLLARLVRLVFLDGAGLEGVQGLLGWLLATSALRAILAWAGEAAGSALALAVKRRLRQALVARLNQRGPAYVQTQRSGELTGLLVEGVEALDAYFSQYLPQIALAGLVPVALLAFIFPIDPLSGLVLALTAPLIPIFMILIGGAAEKLTQRQWGVLSRMSAYFLDVIQGLATLKTLGRSQAQVGVIAAVSERFRQATLSVLRVTFLSSLALELVATLSTAVVAVQVALRLLYGQVSFEPAFFVLLLAPEFYLPLRQLGARFHAGMGGIGAAERIFAVLVGAEEKPGQVESPQPSPQPAAGIEFENVHLTYPDGRVGVQGLTLQVRPGEVAALVGPSGGGKSTALQLLLGFLQPQQGAVLVDGQTLRPEEAASWREKIAWVPQQPHLFYDSVENNIRLARPDASRQAVIAAARQAQAHEFITHLPHGYETLIGERGARLSAGQGQRIALARAFLKDAPLVVLDEATANLDPGSEARIQAALDGLLEGRSALLVAHRLRTAARADRVYVLDQGRVVESGPPGELLRQGGLLAQMADALPGAAQPARGDLPPSRWEDPAPQQSPHDAEPAGEPASQGGLAVFLRLLRLLPGVGWVALAAAAGFAAIGSSLGLLSASAYLISAAALHPSIADLQLAIVGVRFFGLARGVFRYLERYLTHQVTFRLLARLRVWFYQALEPLAPARFISYRSGDLLARIVGDIAALENFYVRGLAPPLAALLVGAAACLYLGSFAPRLGLALAGFLLAAGAAVPALVHLLSRRPGQDLVASRSALSLAVIDALHGMPDLLANGQAERQAERIQVAGESLERAQRRLAHLNGMQLALEALLANWGAWVVLGLGIGLVRAGAFPGVYLAVLVLAALASFEAVQPLPLAAQTLETSLAAARRLFQVVDAEPAVQDPPAALPLPEAFDLEAKDLAFRYPEPGALPALAGMSFRLPPGKRLAVVGPSGAGKSTLVQLLLRFWEYEGSLRLNGQELRGYDPARLRQRLGVVTQNTYLFYASLQENLLLAKPDAAPAELLQALQRAQLDELAARLPHGLDTLIGERGQNLSGGERQRLAIAQALLKDPPLLILDEPTANLDPLTERQVLGAMQALMHGRTTLLITHRLVGMESMDEILVLDQGRVVERGKHAGLLRQEGLYRQLWDVQNDWLGV
jgi:ATP-binding cassette, subfamily C, bacterial CydCD